MPRDYSSTARQWMLDGQLATNKINDPRLQECFSTTPREVFVPALYAHSAYVDEAIALGEGRYMLEPLVLATCIQALQLTGREHVLIVGGSTGYSASIVGQLAKTVVLADDARFVQGLEEKLIYAGCRNVTCIAAKPSDGAPQKAPYDAILIEGAVTQVPAHILSQLREGGRMVYGEHFVNTPTTNFGVSHIRYGEKIAGKLVVRTVGEASLPLLAGFTGAEGFVFS